VPVGLAPVSFTLAEGGYDLYVTANGDKVPMAGPIPLDVVLGEMIVRCRELGLRAGGDEEALLTDFAILLAARSVEYVYGGREWHAL